MKNRIIYEENTINVYLSGKYSIKKISNLKQKISLIKCAYGIENMNLIYDEQLATNLCIDDFL